MKGYITRFVLIKTIVLIVLISLLHTSVRCDSSTDSVADITHFVNEKLKEAAEYSSVNHEKAISITTGLLKLPAVKSDKALDAKIRYRLSLYQLLSAENKEALKNIDYILPYFKIRDKKKWTTLNIRKGSLLIRLGRYQEAKTYLEDAIPYCDSLNMQLNKGMSYIYLGDIYLKKSVFIEAFNNIEKGLQIFKSLDRNEWVASALTDLAYVCISAKDYASAQNYFAEIEALIPEIKNEVFLVRPRLFEGLLYFELGQLDKSKKILKEGIKNIEDIGSFPDMPVIYHNLAKIAITEKKFEEAKVYLESAYKYGTKENNSSNYFRTVLIEIELSKQTDKNPQHLSSLYEIFEWAKQNKDYKLLKKSSLMISTCYEELNQLKKAIKFRDIHQNALKQSIKEDKHNEIALLKGKAELVHNAHQGELREENLQLQINSDKRIKNLLKFSMAVGSLLMMYILYLFYLKKKTNSLLKSNNNKLSKYKLQLEEKNKQLESYIESNIQLEQFAHVASHDLRAPIITINSFSKLLHAKASNKLSTDESKYLDFITNNGEQMLDLVNDLLDYSKINSQVLKVEKVNILELIEEIKSILKPQLIKKDVMLFYGKNDIEVAADRIKLKRVIQNLISNSVRYSDPVKDSFVEISWYSNGDHIKFNVKDNGIGMDQQKVDIFEPYVQLHSKSKYKGTGLGLSITKKLVEKHHGNISYTSEKGVGSTFTFTIHNSMAPNYEPLKQR